MKQIFRLVIPLLASMTLPWGGSAEAASHREAPLIALDPSADNTDVYAFVSYDDGKPRTQPGQSPGHLHHECKSGAGSERRPQLL